MGWKTVIIGTEAKVSLSLDKLRITIGNDFQNIPIVEINTVIFSHNRVVITIPLLVALIEHNINVILCDSKNDPIGVFLPFNGHSLIFKRLYSQITWKITRKKKLWKRIIEQKIQSEIDALELEGARSSTLVKLKELKMSVCTDDNTNREAIAARLYFQEMFGDYFIRGGADVQNYSMNYGYKILASHISRCIASRGLLTQLGIHHKGESNPFNLTYDFIESFRVIVDLWTVENVNDHFNASHKQKVIGLLNAKVFLNGKWMRLNDAMEDIIDSYIGFLEERTNEILAIDISKGIRDEE